MRTKKARTDGTNRYLWETDADWDLYLQYADQRIKFGLEERSLPYLAQTAGLTVEAVQRLHDQNSWATRVEGFDAFWEPTVPTGIEAQICAAEATHYELGALASNILRQRLQIQPHLLTNNQLLAMARLLPTVNRSEASIRSSKD